MAELPRTVVHRAARARARTEMFRPYRIDVDELAKALAGDDADALSADEPESADPVICPECPFIGPPVAVERHMARTGHSTERPERDDTNNYAHGDDRDDDDAQRKDRLRKALASPDTAGIDRLGAAWELANLEGGQSPVKGKRQCTVCGVVVDDTEAGVRKHSQATNHSSFAPYFK